MYEGEEEEVDDEYSEEKEFLQPYIKDIDQFGVLTLAFDKDIERPSNELFCLKGYLFNAI